MLTGVAFALAAGICWGLVFVGPLLLPEYPAALQSVGRYLAFGLIALPLAWLDRARMRMLTRSDWQEALALALVGNLVYYLCLAGAIRHAGAPLPTMIIGTLPVVIAVAANLRAGGREIRLPWRRLVPSLALIGAGIALVNHAELAALEAAGDLDATRHLTGAALALVALACWTWYPLRNADWLRADPTRDPRTWATAQGVATLPLAFAGYALLWLVDVARADPFEMPLGPRPVAFVGLMLAIGLLASWIGTACWNAASRRLPPALGGQLIVFETLSALAYAFALRGAMPPAATLAGIGLLVAGVLVALRTGSSARA